jgi:preprotein translocase subunit SecY
MNKLSLIWKTKDLRTRILWILGLLLVTRIFAHIPIPGVDASALKAALEQNQFLGLLNLFSGGGLVNFSIAMLGVGPYITASIIVQLLTVIIPSWTELQKEGGEAGRLKLNLYMRYLTIPLAALQGFGTIRLLQSQAGGGLIGSFTPYQWLLTLLAVTAGSLFIMWIGEIITEYGIGNGVSLVIFAGIVAQLPFTVRSVASFYDPSKLPMFLGYLAIGLIVIAGIILITEAQRNIPISYARRMRGDKSYGGVNTHLPLRLNQAGVIPIIFAISMLLFPPLIAQFFVGAKTPALANFAQKTIDLFNSQNIYYGIAYFVLVVLFTYFYTAVVFNADDVAENVQKNGGFVPGLRPGKQTADYLYKVLNRITLPGALALGLIAVLPVILQSFTGTQALTLGGTSILIVVAVVIETIKQIQAQLSVHDYDEV